jgi:hypothetical protein
MRPLGEKPIPGSTNPPFTDSVLRLKVENNQAFNVPSAKPSLTFAVADYFTPYRKVWLDFADMDIAASGIVLIPGTSYLVAGGKEGLLYTLDRADLGHFDARPTQPSWHALDIDGYLNDALHDPVCTDPDVSQRVLRCAEYSPQLLNDDPARDFVHQKFQAGVNQYDVPNCSDAMRPCFFGDLNHLDLFGWPKWPHIHGTPVFARFQSGAQFLFVWPEKDYLKRFTFNGTLFDPTPLKSGVIAPPFAGQIGWPGNGMPGGILAVNIDGDQGVVFATLQRCATSPNKTLLGGPCNDQTLGSLRAYDPFTLNEVWNDCGTGPSLPGDCETGHIAKAMQGDKAFCRRRNTLALARWRANHRKRYNEYMRRYMKEYLARKREVASQ